MVNLNILNDTIVLKLLLKTLEGSLYDIALIVQYLYKDIYVVGRLKTKAWFKFENHKWKQTELGPYYELSTEVLELYDILMKYLLQKNLPIYILQDILDTDDINKDNKDGIYEKLQLNCEIITKKLRNVNFKEQVCKECLYIFYDPSFLQKLDDKRNLIGFKNGVYDKDIKELREGKPYDFILLQIDKEFTPPFDENSLKVLDDLIERFETFRLNLLKKRSLRYMFIPN